ncbi:MAG: hypothetical protein P8Y44_04710 [Acidobacteriota bacterium]
MTGDAPIDPFDSREIDVVIEAWDDDLLDGQIRSEDVQQRSILEIVVDRLVQILGPLLEVVQPLPEGLETLFGRYQGTVHRIDVDFGLIALSGDQLEISPVLPPGLLEIGHLRSSGFDRALVSPLQGAVVLPPRGVEKRFCRSHRRIRCVDLLIQPRERLLGRSNLASSFLQLRLFLLDVATDLRQLFLVEALLLDLGFLYQLLLLEVPKLGLQTFPRLCIVGDDHPQRRGQQRQRAQRKPDVQTTETEMTIGLLFGTGCHRGRA